MGDGYTALGLREYRRGLVTIVVSFICSPEGLFCQSFSDYLFVSWMYIVWISNV